MGLVKNNLHNAWRKYTKTWQEYITWSMEVTTQNFAKISQNKQRGSLFSKKNF